MRISILSLVLALAMTTFAAASGSTETPAGGSKGSKPLVAVSILPQEYFVRQIAGDRVDVMVLVGPGQSPHSYEPTPSQMARLAKASAWITIGIDFEHGLIPKVRSLYPAMPLVDSTKGTVYRTLEAHDHEEEGEDHHDEEGEDHDGEEEHHDEEGGPDPHIWLGRQSVVAQSEVIRDALIAADPDGKTQYTANQVRFAAEVNQTFAALQSRLAALKGRTALVYHPAFGYFFDEFAITQIAIETGGKEPTPKTLKDIIDEAQEENAAVVFVQQQFPTAAAQTVARAVNARVVPLDALAPDWLTNIKAMGDALLKAIQ